MEIVKWYLNKVTSQIPGLIERESVHEEIREHLEDHAGRLIEKGISEEAAWREAVSAMGDPESLAAEMGRIHCYDTSKAFSWVIGMLWVGMMLCFIRVGSDVMQSIEMWIGRILMLLALFRLSELGADLKKAFHFHFGSCAAAFLVFAAEALMWENVRNIAGGILTMTDTACRMGMVYSLVNGIYDWADDRGQGYLNIWLIVESAMGIFGIAVMAFWILAGESYQSPLRIDLTDWFGGFGMFLTWGLVGAAICWCIAFVIGSVRVKREIQEVINVGINPFNKKTSLPYLAAMLGIAVIPVLTSGFMSFGMWNTKQYTAAAEAEPESWEIVKEIMCESFPYGREDEFTEYAEFLGTVLPPQEVLLLQEAEWIRLFRLEHILTENGISSFEDGRRTLVLAAKLNGERGESVIRAGCLTVFESPDDGFGGISSFWLDGGHETFYINGEYQPAVVFYEKNGALHEYAANREQTTVGMMSRSPMSVVEYSLKRSADAVYCYQMLEIHLWETTDRMWISFGCENALQKLPVRIPYDMVKYQFAPYSSGVWETYSGNHIAFRNGVVSNYSDMMWEKRGYRTGFEH